MRSSYTGNTHTAVNTQHAPRMDLQKGESDLVKVIGVHVRLFGYEGLQTEIPLPHRHTKKVLSSILRLLVWERVVGKEWTFLGTKSEGASKMDLPNKSGPLCQLGGGSPPPPPLWGEVVYRTIPFGLQSRLTRMPWSVYSPDWPEGLGQFTAQTDQ